MHLDHEWRKINPFESDVLSKESGAEIGKDYSESILAILFFPEFFLNMTEKRHFFYIFRPISPKIHEKAWRSSCHQNKVYCKWWFNHFSLFSDQQNRQKIGLHDEMDAGVLASSAAASFWTSKQWRGKGKKNLNENPRFVKTKRDW